MTYAYFYFNMLDNTFSNVSLAYLYRPKELPELAAKKGYPRRSGMMVYMTEDKHSVMYIIGAFKVSYDASQSAAIFDRLIKNGYVGSILKYADEFEKHTRERAIAAVSFARKIPGSALTTGAWAVD